MLKLVAGLSATIFNMTLHPTPRRQGIRRSSLSSIWLLATHAAHKKRPQKPCRAKVAVCLSSTVDRIYLDEFVIEEHGHFAA